MIKNTLKLLGLCGVTLFMVSCSTTIYQSVIGGGNKSTVVAEAADVDSSQSQYNYIIDSLKRTEVVQCDLEIIHREDLPVVDSIENPSHYIPEFTSDESSHFTLSSSSYVMKEDVVLKYSDMAKEFTFPVDTGYVTSPYGWRHGRMHAGVDIKAHKGDNIYAVFDGVVRMSKYYSAFGNVVVIRHYNGMETVYAHASKLLVAVNQKVKSGDLIALAGRTGRASGDHLHFEVRFNGQHVNPSILLDIPNLKLQDKNIYVTMRDGKVFASNNDSSEVRNAEIKEITSVKYHTVRSGDTLSRIAANNGTTVTNLCKLNKISSKSILRLGQRIRVR
ncbi:MAG: M23 family metallopeptidase [Rikenellaceae bacterium]